MIAAFSQARLNFRRPISKCSVSFIIIEGIIWNVVYAFLEIFAKQFFMKTLGIETSCDETAVALYDSTSGIISETVYSQIDLHKKYGGVVPELASRDHCEKIIDVFNEGIGGVSVHEIDRIAYTAGPGLLGALIVGESFAQGLAFALNKPLIPINHLEAHFLSPFLDFPEIQYPFTSLLVSGGHSLIVDVKDFEDYEIIGQSVDDAVGEAFDKVGKLLQLPYPGGPHIEEAAKRGDPARFDFPRPMKYSDDLNLSFSGLKTAVLYATKDLNINDERSNISASFQEAVIDVLSTKIKKAMKQTGNKSLVMAGGVAANKKIRAALDMLEENEGIKVFYPSIRHCTDNAAMVAYLGSLKIEGKNIYNSNVRARWPVNEI